MRQWKSQIRMFVYNNIPWNIAYKRLNRDILTIISFRARIEWDPIVARCTGASCDLIYLQSDLSCQMPERADGCALIAQENESVSAARDVAACRTAESRLRVDSHGLGLYRLSGERKITRPVRSRFKSERDLVVAVPRRWRSSEI